MIEVVEPENEIVEAKKELGIVLVVLIEDNAEVNIEVNEKVEVMSKKFWIFKRA